MSWAIWMRDTSRCGVEVDDGVAMPGDAVIQVRGLRKRYGTTEAVAGIDLEVYRGEIFAFLGPNGAGKTTTVEILEGFRDRSDGDVTVLGTDPTLASGSWRNRVGCVLQESAAEPGLTVRECLQLYAGYYQRPRDIDDTLTLVGLQTKGDSLGEALSGGQRRRLDVALALIGDPELVFLDEPTTGFDPSARRQAWEVISGLRALGKTVFLTTHYMEEAENLADRIAVIANGRIVAQGAPHTLGGRERMASRISFTLPSHVSRHDLPMRVCGDGRRVSFDSQQALTDAKSIGDWASQRGLELPDLEIRRPSLEDVYLSLTAGAA